MPFAAASFDAHTIGLMTAALEAAWVAARLSVPGLSHDGCAKMECAILIKVTCGERDFKQLKLAAFDAVFDPVGAIAKPVERRHVDEQYFAVLSKGTTEIPAEDAMELPRIFGEDGEMTAARLELPRIFGEDEEMTAARLD